MKSWRILGAASVVALSVLSAVGAGPARADAPVITVNTPGQGATITTAALTVTGSVEMRNGGTVTRASVVLASPDGVPVDNPRQDYDGSANSSRIFSASGSRVNFSWTISPRYNAAYTITANGSGTDPNFDLNPDEPGQQVVRSFSLKVAPQAPSGVAASLDDASSKATVTWSANPEPDMVGYTISRALGQGSFKRVGVAGAVARPSFVDDLSGMPGGQYRYEVVAVRKAKACSATSTDPACVISSSPSSAAAVTLRAETTTTTTSTTSTTLGSGSGSGSGTGSGGTSGSSTGSSSTKPGSSSSPSGGLRPPGGRVDLSDFASLLNGTGVTTHTTDPTNEGTYQDKLGYKNRPAPSGDDPGPAVLKIGGHTIVPRPSDDWVKFIGAGSLATAMLVHVLWFKQQVDRVPLEAIVGGGASGE